MNRSKRLIQSLVALVFGVLLPVAAFAQFQQSWVRSLDPPAGASRMTLDGQGNICVAGGSAGNFLTIKYSADGTQLWSQNFGDSAPAGASAIAADGTGQVWVTGGVTTNGLLTIKNDANGTLLWARRFEETSPLLFSSQVGVDSAGNAYVATAIPSEHILIKYSPAGDQLWVRRYSIPGRYISKQVLALDSAGNLISSSWAGAAFLTLKYDPSGNLLWAANDDWGGKECIMSDMTVDPSDNVYVTGSSYRNVPGTSFPRHYFLTAKYSPSGQVLWAVTRPPYQANSAVARAVRVDSKGNVIITGYDTRPIDEDADRYTIVTVKYDSAGAELWTARSGFSRTPGMVAVDEAGNIYVGGTDLGTYHLLLLKYAPNGSQLTELLGPAASGLIELALDRNGNLYTLDRNYEVGVGVATDTRKFIQIANPSQPIASIVPHLQQVLPGSDVTFTANVSGPGPFTYQWRHSGFGLGNRAVYTNSTLQLNPIRFEDAGNYTVVVSNSAGYTISAEARLDVMNPPTTIPSEPIDQYAAVGQTVTFSAVPFSWPPFQDLVYQWYFENAPIPAATNETFTLRNANPTNAGNYWVVASNPVGSVTSRLARLQFVSSVRTAATHVRVDAVGYTALPYPLAITVQGATGTLSKLVVTLHDFSHAFPAALDILLAGPRGQTVMLMSDAGPPMDFKAVNLTFDDDATSTLPPQDSSTRLTSGTYKPTDYFIVRPEDDPDDIFPAPAPPQPYGNALSAFNNTDPNGTWHLFVINEGGFGTFWGWELTLIGVGGEVTVPPRLYLERREDETAFDFFWDGAPDLKLQHTKSLANPVWTDFPGSEGQSHAVVGLNEVSEFFRLFKP